MHAPLAADTPGSATSRFYKRSKKPLTRLGERIMVAYERTEFESLRAFARHIYNEDGSSITPACFGQWLYEGVMPRSDKLEQIAKLGGVDVGWLTYGGPRDIDERDEKRPPKPPSVAEGMVSIKQISSGALMNHDPITIGFWVLPTDVLKKYTNKTVDIAIYQIEIDHNGWKKGDCVIVDLADRNNTEEWNLIHGEVCLMLVSAKVQHQFPVKGHVIGALRIF